MTLLKISIHFKQIWRHVILTKNQLRLVQPAGRKFVFPDGKVIQICLRNNKRLFFNLSLNIWLTNVNFRSTLMLYLAVVFDLKIYDFVSVDFTEEHCCCWSIQWSKKPGGKVLRNILDHSFWRKIMGVGIRRRVQYREFRVFKAVRNCRKWILAIVAHSCSACWRNIESSCFEKNLQAFIVFSSGFQWDRRGRWIAGKALCVNLLRSVGGTLIGPNCIERADSFV